MSDSDKNDNHEALSEFERQLERSGFFTHNSLSNQAERINEIESFLYGLIDTLIAGGVIDKNTLEKKVRQVSDETFGKQEHFHAGIAMRIDHEDKIDISAEVDCKDRLPVCKAVCCKLNFTLSVDEIESGKIKWDLGQPYYIRQKSDGYCTHLKSENFDCSLLQNHPKVCSKYSCINDERVWIDFEKMELNYQWIEENLKENKVQLQEIYMIPEDRHKVE